MLCAGGEFRTRDLQIMSIALVGEPLEFTNSTGTLTRLSYPGITYAKNSGKLNDSTTNVRRKVFKFWQCIAKNTYILS